MKGTPGNKVYDFIFSNNNTNNVTKKYDTPTVIWDHGIIQRNGLPKETMTAGMKGIHVYVETTQDNTFVKALGIVIN